MTNITLTVHGAQARASVNGPLTSGMVGIPVTIEYDDIWNGLTKNLVCRCGRWDSAIGQSRTILNVEASATVAHEVMQADTYLYLGVEGYNADGTLVIPTTWAECGKIQPGANTDGDPSATPTLPIWARLQAKIAELMNASLDKEQINAAIAQYLEENHIQIPEDSLPCRLTVETITIGESEEPEEPVNIPVTGIILDYSSISLTEGESMMLAASVMPGNATNNLVLWESSDTSIATVENGYVTAVASGNCTITAKSAENSSIQATCALAVTAKSGGDEPGSGGTGSETVKVYLQEHDLVVGKLRNKSGNEASVANACYVEIPYYDGMYIITSLKAAWLGNYPPFVVYDNDTNNIAEYTYIGAVGDVNAYQTTLTGYSANAKVFVNIAGYYKNGALYSNNSCTISQAEYCYYTYES